MTRRLCAVLALCLGLVGCGVPTSGDPTVIPAGEVPYGLASPTPSTPSSPPEATMVAEAGIYLLTAEDVLTLRGRELGEGSLEERLEELLGQLATGPSEQERDEELSTALPPAVELHVTEISDGTATVDISGPVDAPSGGDARLAVAQIVLTATVLPEVQAVRLTREGEPVDAPLPDGAGTSEPLTADEFEVFLTPPAPSSSAPPSASPAG
jgi:hypothetical protein